MKKKTVLSTFLKWLNTSELFARPSKQLPGKWVLFEYYNDLEGELINVKEEQLKAKHLFWNIEFMENEEYAQNSNLSVPLVSSIENGTWSISKNFITLIHPQDFRNNVEFQFAIEKDDLKLLKKDSLGKIEFFGFSGNKTPNNRKPHTKIARGFHIIS